MKISKWLCPGHMGGAQCTLEEEEEKVIKNVIKGLASEQNPSPASFQKQGQDPTQEVSSHIKREKMQVESPPFITYTWSLGEGHMTLEKSFHFLYEGFSSQEVEKFLCTTSSCLCFATH